MKPHYHILLGTILIASAHAAIVTDTVVLNKSNNWSHVADVTATQTSNNGDGNVANASRAIDDVYNGEWAGGSVSHTQGSTALGEYWQVDLGASRDINGVNIFNRTDCCGGRLSGYSILASNDSSFSTTAFDSGTQTYTPGNFTGLSFAEVNARYVRIVRDVTSNAGDNVISFAEVDVLGSPYGYSNLALGSTPNQSTTLINSNTPTANKATDGILANSFNASSTTHTDPGAPAGAVYWETTFTSLTDINEIALHNRADCCQSRLSNFRVSIYDGATEIWGNNYFAGTGNAGNIFSIQEDTGAFIGRGDRVRVELIGGLNNDGNNILSLREVEVYGVAVPEPSSTALLGLASLALIIRRKK